MKYEYVVYDCGHEVRRTKAELCYEDDDVCVYKYVSVGGIRKICVTLDSRKIDALNPHGRIEVVKETVSAHYYLMNLLSDDSARQCLEILERLGVDPSKKVEVE